MQEEEDERIVCEHCEDHIEEDCERSVYTSISQTDTEVWCEPCHDTDTYHCPQCMETYSNDVEHYSFDCETYCAECYNEVVVSCEECGEDMWREGDAPVFTEDGCTYCESCAPHRSGSVHSYHDGPSPVPLTMPDDPPGFGGLLAGLEFEVSGDEDDIVEAFHKEDEDENIFWLEYDSSCTIEAPFHPFSWAYYKEHIRPMLGRINQSLKDAGCHTWVGGECGLHVHLSKDMFTRIQRVKLFRLIYDNSAEILQLSGRRSLSHSYSNLDIGTVREQVAQEGRMKCKDKDYTGSKYRALHFTNKTIEFRFMRGNLNGGAQAAVENAFAMFEFTKSQSMEDMTWKSYIAWLSDNKHIYPSIWEYAVRREVPLPGNTEWQYTCDAVRHRAKAVREYNPWRSSYKKITKGDEVIIIKNGNENAMQFMVPEMQKYINKKGTYLHHTKHTVLVRHNDGTEWMWPRSAVRRISSGTPKQGDDVLMKSAHQMKAISDKYNDVDMSDYADTAVSFVESIDYRGVDYSRLAHEQEDGYYKRFSLHNDNFILLKGIV